MKKILFFLVTLIWPMSFYAMGEKIVWDNKRVSTQLGYYSPSTHRWEPLIHEGWSYMPSSPEYWPSVAKGECSCQLNCPGKEVKSRNLIAYSMFAQKTAQVRQIVHDNDNQHLREIEESSITFYPTQKRWGRIALASTIAVFSAACIGLKWFNPWAQKSK